MLESLHYVTLDIAWQAHCFYSDFHLTKLSRWQYAGGSTVVFSLPIAPVPHWHRGFGGTNEWPVLLSTPLPYTQANVLGSSVRPVGTKRQEVFGML
jgi:hypothetical protein